MLVVRLKSDKVGLKKLEHLKNNIFIIYSPKTVVIETENTTTVDTELILKLPSEARAFLKKIQEINDGQKHRLWITVLNESYFDKDTIKKDEPLGYLFVEPEHLKVHYEEAKRQRRSKKQKNYLPRDWEKRYWQKKKASTAKRGLSQPVWFCLCW